MDQQRPGNDSWNEAIDCATLATLPWKGNRPRPLLQTSRAKQSRASSGRLGSSRRIPSPPPVCSWCRSHIGEMEALPCVDSLNDRGSMR